MKTGRPLLLSLVFLTVFPPGPAQVFAGPKKGAAADSTSSSSTARRAGIVAFCAKNRGKAVGNGECWTLANEAFKQVGAKRPDGELRVWGRMLNLKREAPAPGDILECDRTRFADGSYTPGNHTAVIIGTTSTQGVVKIAEQNFAGKRKVTERLLDLNGVQSGRIFVYRP